MPTSALAESHRLQELLRREHHALAELLVALSDFDRRRVWVELGHTSLFWFLHRDLGLSKGAAFYRKTAAELLQRFPEVIEPLRDGRLCLTSMAELAKVLTPENVAEVLPRFFSLSRREAMEITAALLPVDAPPLRDVVTAVRQHAPATEAAGSAVASAPTQELAPAAPGSPPPSRGSPVNLPRANPCVPDEVSASAVTPVRPGFEVEPLTADLRRLHLTVSRRLLEKLDAAADALSHSHPGATRDEIIEVGLDLILERQAKRRGLVQNPRKKPAAAATPTPPRPRSRYIPAHIRRAVFERDRGQCQYRLASGAICGSTSKPELHHTDAFALGGETSIDKLEIRCRSHNLAEARLVFGDALMNLFTRRPPTAREHVAEWAV